MMAATLLKLGPKSMIVKRTLSEYEQHNEMHVYRPYRYLGYSISLASLAFGIYSLVSNSWVTDGHTGVSLGIWDTCYSRLQRGQLQTSAEVNEYCQPKSISQIPQWQSVVLGLMIFSLTFGLIASILTTCGVFTGDLAKKVYYYHSSGEIYFVCCICATAALIAYPGFLRTVNPDGTHRHYFGLGYYLGWGTPLCYFCAALFMTLDEVAQWARTTSCHKKYKQTRANQSSHV